MLEFDKSKRGYSYVHVRVQRYRLVVLVGDSYFFDDRYHRSCTGVSTGNFPERTSVTSLCSDATQYKQLSRPGSVLVSDVIACFMVRASAMVILGAYNRYLGTNFIWVLHHGKAGFFVSVEQGRAFFSNDVKTDIHICTGKRERKAGFCRRVIY